MGEKKENEGEREGERRAVFVDRIRQTWIDRITVPGLTKVVGGTPVYYRVENVVYRPKADKVIVTLRIFKPKGEQ